MRSRLSEEQRRARRCKLAVVSVVTAVLGAAYGVGPGLRKVFLTHALKHREEPWAADWVYWIARVEEFTFRREEAQELYVQLWMHYSGDEEESLPLLRVIETYHPDWELAYLPWEAARLEEGERLDWVGGEGADPHPRLADGLVEHARYYEDHRHYLQSTFLFRVVIASFPGTEAAERAEQGMVRAALNPYAPG